MINRETATFKRTYGEDMALYPFPLPKITVIAIVAWTFLGFPWIASDYFLNLANIIGIACLGAIGLNILLGYTGQISIGHAAFMAVGAYTAAALQHEVAMPWVPAMLAGGSMAALVGTFFGLPSLRIRGLYLAVATLAAQLIIEWFINHFGTITGKNWLGSGAEGSVFVDRPSIPWFSNGEWVFLELSSNRGFYFLIYIILAIGTLFALNLFRTHLGRSFIAVRDRDIAAEIIGINIFRAKLTAFAISSFYAGITGVLYTYFYTVATTEAFTLGLSIQFLAMVIIGGLGSILGSFMGAIFISMLPIGVDFLLRGGGGSLFGWDDAFVSSFLPQVNLMLFGGLIMFFLVMEPDGLSKLWRNFTAYFRVWPFPYL